MSDTDETVPGRETLPAGDREEDYREETVVVISSRLLSAVVVTILALLVVVVVVGLARDNLDTTGVATVLSTLFSGIVVGVLLKGKGSPP